MNDRKQRRRRRSRNGFLDILNGLLSLLVLGLLIAGGVVLYGASQFYGDGPTTAETTFRVEAGSGLSSIAPRLEEQGLISNQYIFQVGSRVAETAGTIKQGDFRIPGGSSMADILTELTTGNPIRYALVIPEGLTSWEVVQRLNADTNIVGEIPALPAEGSILPGSYDYVPGDTRQSVLDKMQTAMATELAAVWESRQADLPIDTPEQLVVLASIVEKETGVASERPQVAAVFVNRLRESMRLQSDPTIIYGITKGQSTLGRGLRRSEIDARTDYNTYQIDGLPPTPIANPGIDALKAVANPDSHDYLYFVAKGATPAEGHVFAETYPEHQDNVAQYRRIVDEAAAQAEEARQALEAEEAGEATP
ncbi:MAG: endolytic transglycosylase MltG [Candidatus Devosia phytovorans]|uniref:Endolytic murein transglycosylase n=1 Tax=Candidatus Devosia phytovorans TaxID=3121372 RepID=A0AAJ5VYZ4_9HYPH|nr:endolytic transglycosylase MltG [Devosia sp.]WEK06601.1 MAG: endolytic transglycosylase MltG [Devosia sp.]